MMHAADAGHLAVAKVLVEAGANLNRKESHGYTALMLAKRYGKVEVASFLQAAVEAQSKEFVAALQKGDAQAVKDVIARGAEVDARDPSDFTPLMFAAQNGKADIATVLLDAGATVDAASREGGTALMYAANRGDLPIVQLLVNKGAKIDVQAPDGSTALTLAEKGSFNDVVRLLRYAGRRGGAPPERTRPGRN